MCPPQKDPFWGQITWMSGDPTGVLCPGRAKAKLLQGGLPWLRMGAEGALGELRVTFGVPWVGRGPWGDPTGRWGNHWERAGRREAAQQEAEARGADHHTFIP